MDRKKVIVIGSGLGGLSSGVVLAKNGYRVTVLEQDALPGGCLQCFCRRGVKFETGMHFIGSADEGQILNKMMRYLEIDGQVELARLDTDRYNVVSLQGEEFEFANGREAFIERMASQFPGQTDNLARYCRLVESISAASSLHTLKYGQTDGAVTAEYQLRSVNEVVEEIITDPLLQKVLVGDLPLYAAVRDKTPFSVHAFIMDFYNRSAFRFVGGSDVLVRALTDVLTGHGGEVRTRSRVTRIVCDATHAIGVEVNGGEFLPAHFRRPSHADDGDAGRHAPHSSRFSQTHRFHSADYWRIFRIFALQREQGALHEPQLLRLRHRHPLGVRAV